ncbi:MAG: SDR family NAD(P)-dependent oxidoreductase [Lactobacillaceae bacterium]|jgi:short-subunit dehydrogenase|nr:SDR family NAD(P)-dependent oxidoreductase [Lactobacillaceae bacterium]
MEKQKVVAITGASNGMGEAAVRLFASKGWIVYGGARRVEKIPTGANIHALKLDVTDSTANHAFIETIVQAQGRLDVLINNAGYGEYGPVEDTSMANARKQFETNFFGAVELTQLVLPIMRAQKMGRIVNISSIGGDVYMPLGSYYHATKAALQHWSDSLDVEIQAFGVRSIVVQPGGTRSAWGNIAMDNSRKNLQQNSPYTPLVTRVGAILAADARAIGATADDLAKVFYAAATDVKPKRRYFNAVGDRVLVHVARAHPRVFKTAFMATLNFLGKRVENK